MENDEIIGDNDTCIEDNNEKTPLPQEKRVVPKDRRIVCDRRCNRERRREKSWRLPFFERRKNKEDRRSRKDRRHGIDRRLFDLRASYKTKKRNEFGNRINRPKAKKLDIMPNMKDIEIYKKNIFADFDKQTIADASGKILAFVWRNNTIEDGEGNNFIEIYSHDKDGDITIEFDDPSGDATIQHNSSEKHSLNIENSIYETINIATERDITILIGKHSIGQIKIGSESDFIKTGGISTDDLSHLQKRSPPLVTIMMYGIGESMQNLSHNLFRFGKMSVEIGNSPIFEISDGFNRRCRISGPAGQNNLRKFRAGL